MPWQSSISAAIDADRGGVQGLVTAPMRAAGVPGNAILGHQPIKRAVFGQHVMRADAMLAHAIT
jgi:predicted transcriptional regulator